MNLKIKNAKLVVPLAIILILLLTIILIFWGSLTNNECQNQEYDYDYYMSKFTSGTNFPDYKEPIPGLANTLRPKDTLTIVVEFAHCGEWGGHKEIIRLFNNEESTVIAYFTRDSVCCSKIIENKKGIGVLDDRERIITLDFKKQLSAEDLKLLNLFFHRMLELSLHFDSWYWYDKFFDLQSEKYGNDEEPPLFMFKHADVGWSISIESSSSEFKIGFYNFDMRVNTWYGLIRDKIFGNLLQEIGHY